MTVGNCLPVLTYHSLDDSGSVISTAPSLFKKQMGYLFEQGFRTLSLSEVVHLLRERKPFPKPAFVITFDDGYQNVYKEAFPVLQAYSFKATIFLITDYCGKNNNWPGHELPAGVQPLLSWPDIKEMYQHGIEFGAHTLSHPDLTKISVKEAEQEIAESKVAIQDRLGQEVSMFAYPYGWNNPSIQDIVKHHFQGACSTKLGTLSPKCDPFLLKRIDMYYLSNTAKIGTISTRTFEWYLGLRQAAREVKQFFN